LILPQFVIDRLGVLSHPDTLVFSAPRGQSHENDRPARIAFSRRV
jgi:hypothetical protein